MRGLACVVGDHSIGEDTHRRTTLSLESLGFLARRFATNFPSVVWLIGTLESPCSAL